MSLYRYIINIKSKSFIYSLIYRTQWWNYNMLEKTNYSSDIKYLFVERANVNLDTNKIWLW